MPYSYLLRPAKKKYLILGNVAVARGLLEEGLNTAFAYPGTPASETIDSLTAEWKNNNSAMRKIGVKHVCYSTNEKVGAEAAVMVAYCKGNSFTCMKHVGLNVAADCLATAPTTKIKGGMLVMVSDDPGCHSSQNEMDTRWMLRNWLIPIFEPRDPKEAKDYTKKALAASREYNMITSLRMTTRVSHARQPVLFEKIKTKKEEISFEPDTENLLVTPQFSRQNHRKALNRMQRFQKEYAEKTTLNQIIEGKDTSLGIITSGVSFGHAKETYKNNPILKLGIVNPLPTKLIKEFREKVRKIRVVEETEPYLEESVKSILYEGIPIEGKNMHDYSIESEKVPRTGEFTIGVLKGNVHEVQTKTNPAPRPPILCAGCPHRASFYLLGQAFEKMTKKKEAKQVIIAQDIGCYSLGVSYNCWEEKKMKKGFGDTMNCMSSSIGHLVGMASVLGKDILKVGVIGDSTYFHGATPGVECMVEQWFPGLLVVLDNSYTAMTGGQENPGTHGKIKIEKMLKAAEVPVVKVMDPYDMKNKKKVLELSRQALSDFVSIVMKRECSLKAQKHAKKEPFTINDKCNSCGICLDKFGCPAIFMEERTHKLSINQLTCNGCGVCEQLCPNHNIKQRAGEKHE